MRYNVSRAMFSDTGKILIIIGVFLVVFGIIFVFWGRIPFLGRLPEDIAVQKGNVSFFFPLATSIVISLVLTVLLNLFFRLFR
jgi:hypothetical protein